MVCCLPGDGVKYITEQLENIRKDEGEQPESVLQNNTINTAKEKDEILLANYNEPGKNQDARVVISRLLTTQYSSSYMGTTVM